MTDLLTYVRSWFEWVEAFPSSEAIRASTHFYPFLLTTHIVGMSLFAGLLIMMDLRLLGIGNMKTPLSQVQKRLFPWQMLGMTLSFSTGLLLVYGQPMRFYGNIFFWVKTVMMLMAAVNAMAFHRISYRTVDTWDAQGVTPLGARLAGALGLALWVGVVLSGRLIAYSWFSN